MEKKKEILKWVFILSFIVILVMSFFVGSNDESSSKKGSGNELTEDANVIIANAQKESSSVKDGEKKELSEIRMDTYLEYFNGSEDKIVLIARPTCQYCQVAEPIIQNVAFENDLDIYYLNTDNFEGEDEANLVRSDDFFSEGFGTPLLLVVKDGKIVNKVDGLTDKAHYIDFFKNTGFIK